MAKELVSDDSDDEDVEYKGHFCSGCSIPPPGGVWGWVRWYVDQRRAADILWKICFAVCSAGKIVQCAGSPFMYPFNKV